MLLRRYHKQESKLNELTLKELKELAKEKGVENYSKLTKEEIIKCLTK